MTSKLLALLLLTSSALASPVPDLEARQTCQLQSCTIAALSGSSGQTYNPATAPSGGTDAGDCCIISYNPAVQTKLFQEKPQLQAECAALGINKRSPPALDAVRAPAVEERAACAAYTLIYAVGTSETPPLGETVGPALASGLTAAAPGKWSIQGVQYDPSIDGDDCLGLPGGVIGTKLLDSVASQCPSTKIVVAGYSQGAMVAHNTVAGSRNSGRVNGVVVFGDPFDGAPIKGYSGPIKTYCAVGDTVCDGEFIITAAHLSYVGVDTTAAVVYISNLVR
ncbi:hypothetical protein MMC10_006769 [Thelotrema lepadinum]|nr:hypothetical protein [Thelotrema lepadinum]